MLTSYAAEDTRHTGKLLSHFGISTKTFALHDHNEQQKAQVLVEKLLAGYSIALVSDAGTPLISDRIPFGDKVSSGWR